MTAGTVSILSIRHGWAYSIRISTSATTLTTRATQMAPTTRSLGALRVVPFTPAPLRQSSPPAGSPQHDHVGDAPTVDAVEPVTADGSVFKETGGR
jgi:hypothetical protein